jgi:DNA-binding LytR/AlgR family response regulator
MSTKLKCIILDDELPGLAYLKLLCEQIPELELVKVFNDPLQLLAESSTLDFDLCIIDIEMPALNGLDLARALAGKLVIFTTAYREYAADAFEVDAVDYIRKPFQKERLRHAVLKAVDRLEQKRRNDVAQFNTDLGRTILNFAEVAVIRTSENDSRDKKVLLTDGKTIVIKNTSFEQLISILPPGEFVRVNKQELIALRIVRSYTNSDVTSSLNESGKPIRFSLGEAYRASFLTAVSKGQIK